MKKLLLNLILSFSFLFPAVSYAGVPLFFNTGDELFTIEGAPEFDEGYSVGYACQRLGLFGADLWTWDCELTAVNLEEFSVADLPEEMLAKLSDKYTIADRVRSPWSQFGGIGILLVLVIAAVVKFLVRKKTV